MIELSYSEKDIEDILFQHSEKFLDIRAIKRQYPTKVGVVDLIAQSTSDKDVFFVIEIKKDFLDCYAYCQVLRYSNWLNSEKSKNGKRKFFPVLIGKDLSADLYHLCDYFEEDHSLSLIYKPTYRLFHFDPLQGVSFTYVNTEQNKIVTKIHEFCHISDLEMKNESLYFELYLSKKDN